MLLFHLFFNELEDRGPAAAVDGFFIAFVSFRDCTVVALGGGEGSDAIFFGEIVGDGEVVLRDIGHIGIVGVDGGILEVFSGLDLFDGSFHGDEFDAIKIAFPEEGAAFFPVGEGFATEHISFGFSRIGEGIPDFGCGGIDGDHTFYNQWLVHSVDIFYNIS